MSTWGEWLGLSSSEGATRTAENGAASSGKGETGSSSNAAAADDKAVEEVRKALESGAGVDAHEHHMVYDGKEVDETEFKQSAFAEYASMVGMDVMNMSLSLPIYCFEPSTVLSRMSETFEFAHLLNTAASQTDPAMKHAYVAAFIVSSYAHSAVRTLKPFDSVPGETFEMHQPEIGVRYVAEHVRDEPRSLSIGYCEGQGWSFTEDVQAKAVFHGNSLEISNDGHRKLIFDNANDGPEVLSWLYPSTNVCNLFLGGTYIDHHGELTVRNHSTGMRIVMRFTQSGWFESGRFEVKGAVVGENDQALVLLEGKWNEYLVAKKPQKTDAGETETDMETDLWRANDHVDKSSAWNFTKLAKSYFDARGEEELARLPLTDSRQRRDVSLLFQGRSGDSSDARSKVLFKQNARKNADGGVDAESKVRYFKKVDSELAHTDWDFAGTYWDDIASLTPEQRLAQALF